MRRWEQMKHSRSLVALLAVVPMVAACGSASASPTSPPAPAQLTAAPADLVLHAADLADGYVAVAKNTGKISLAKELQDESALSRRVDRVAYQGGYSAQFATNMGGVLSASFEYRSQSAATTVGNDRTGVASLMRSLGGHMTAVPPTAPGINTFLIAGTESIGSVHIPAFVYKWQHGTVLAVVFVYGRGLTPGAVSALANRQNSRIKNAGL
jgi:hypothetical protein